MPRNTFLNLPKAKRKLIESVSLDEFAKYGFEQASINRIVKAAGIAKGSFYQYFEDKFDLFKHLLNVIGQMKLAYVSPVLQNPFEHDFFTLLEELYRTGLEFGRDNPKAAEIGLEMFQNKTNPSFQAFMEESKSLGEAFYLNLLDLAISKNEVDASIDKKFIVNMLINLQLASLDYYFDTTNNEEISVEDWDDNLMPIVKQMISFIKNGIQQQ